MNLPPPDPRPAEGTDLLPGAGLPPAVRGHLRRSLEVLRDEAQDPAVRGRIEDVLAGRGTLRDLAGDGAFGAFVEPLVERGLRRIDELTPEERARVAADAEALGRDQLPEHLREERPTDAPRPPDLGTW